ncbi:hypothetical protein PENCOP_c007G05398 [Penicillium coprophilum]|uniref:Glutamyl/glutaminyl-tRNA synthetase class Ib catalytic domain-containing protein n=1 Tax=Penicillium coprophilum TaxID=36646 RepID=A0A1V6ULG2_9EURO|nr:hypothetical protein PENCOP_c007G05398 [Penicillium coprophilum]
MTQFNLFVATRASEAALLPVVLIVFSINEARPSPIINISLEDTAQFTEENEWISQLNFFDTLDFKFLDPILSSVSILTFSLGPFFRAILFQYRTLHYGGALRGNCVAAATIKRGVFVNLTRWYRFLEELCPLVTSAVKSLTAASCETRLARTREGASYNVALKNTENGVVTRFPPKPSGYLHIGHTKAALLNDYFAHEKYSGTLILRFDDTNPSKEKQEFQDGIVEDLALMGIRPDIVSYTSDYLDQLYDYCLQIIKIGKAYADDTNKETINKQRWDGIPSKRRNLSPRESLAHLEYMKKGTPEGLRWCIRARISIDDNSKCLRDPVIYRCNPSTHHRTGNTWNIYPTYDFACPIVGSMEGVAHALRTSEYRERSPQYQWMLDTLKLHTVQV